jgi:cytochrome c553/mono/diheme cytochrome c family protein
MIGPTLRRTLFRILRWTLLVVALAVLGIYAISEAKLHRKFEAPLVPLHSPAAIDTSEGRRMAKIVGCWAGCHGMEGQGGKAGLDGVFRNTAPTLSQVLPRYSDEELVRLIRYGVKRDGHSAVGMISYTFWPLGDADIANLIGHLRAQPVVPPVERKLRLWFLGRFALATGLWKVSAEQVDRTIPRWGELPRTTAFERGRYLASVTCTECHGLDFRGDKLEGGPSLAILGGYEPAQFQHLMRTGEPIGGRDLGIMSWTARVGFSNFTDQEIADVYEFLRTYHGVEPAN